MSWHFMCERDSSAEDTGAESFGDGWPKGPMSLQSLRFVADGTMARTVKSSSEALRA